MILQIATYIGITVLGMIVFFLGVGCIIAIFALIEYWRECRKIKNEEDENPQDLKKEIKSSENKEKSENHTNDDTTYSRGFFAKLHDILIISSWVIIYAIWFVLMCIIGFFSWMFELVTACFKRNKNARF